jgi:hypothetical protein
MGARSRHILFFVHGRLMFDEATNWLLLLAVKEKLQCLKYCMWFPMLFDNSSKIDYEDDWKMIAEISNLANSCSISIRQKFVVDQSYICSSSMHLIWSTKHVRVIFFYNYKYLVLVRSYHVIHQTHIFLLAHSWYSSLSIFFLSLVLLYQSPFLVWQLGVPSWL